MKKPKILIIGTTDKKGGAAAVSWNLVEGLREKGYWIKHIVGYKHSDSAHVHQLPTPLGRDLTLFARHLRSYILANDQDFGQDEQIFNHPWYEQADIVHLHNTHGNYITLKGIRRISQEKKLVWTMHDMWPITSHCAYTTKAHDLEHDPLDCTLGSYPPILWNNREKLWSKKEKVLLGSDITYISSSLWLKKKFRHAQLKSKKTIQIYNGIDTDIFKNINQDTSRNILNIPQESSVALFIAAGGKRNKRKGYPYVENLAKKNKDTLFVIVGGGRHEHREGNKLYIPKISNKKRLAIYYNAADVFVFPSLADNNPQVVLEALSCHLPVLGFDATGTTELIDHKKNGYLANFKNGKDLQKGLEYLLDSKPTSKDFSTDYSARKMVELHEKLYKNIY